jgi:hypothetical protein
MVDAAEEDDDFADADVVEDVNAHLAHRFCGAPVAINVRAGQHYGNQH